MFLILSGDQSLVIAARQESRGANGNQVHELMQDYPRATDEDDWLRLLRFHPARKRIEVLTYSPAHDSLCGGAGYLPGTGSHLFSLDIADALNRHAQGPRRKGDD